MKVKSESEVDLVTKQQIFLLASFKDVPDILAWVEILKN